MKKIIYLILLALCSSCHGQKQKKLFSNYQTINAITEYSGKGKSKPFYIKIAEQASFNFKNRNYHEVQMSDYGLFYLAIDKNVIYTILGDINGIYSEDVLLTLQEETQTLGNPFKGNKCFFERKRDSTYYYTCVDALSNIDINKIPFEIRMLAISKDKGFEQLILRDKETEKYYISQSIDNLRN